MLTIKFLIFKWKWYALIFLVSGLFAYITDKSIELLFFFISYYSLRYLFPKTFHHKDFYKCIGWSIVMMVVACYNVLPIHISLLSSVPIAYVVDIVLCYIQGYIDVSNLIQTLKHNPASINVELLRQAFIKFKTPLHYRDYLEAVLINGYKDVDWFNKPENKNLLIDEQQYRNYKYKFLKRIKDML